MGLLAFIVAHESMPEDRRNQEPFDFEGIGINAAAIVADPQTKPSQIIYESPKRVIEASHGLGISQRSEAATISLVNRLFSMFPQGGPGLALLLLRISVAAAFFINTANRIGLSSIGLLIAGAMLISISLAIGFLTPFLSVIACAFAAANLLIGPNSGALIGLFSILDAAALALLGPGAYSVDARLFGRRVIIVPPHTDRK